MREAMTKAQESYLAGVVYSKYRVDLNRYFGPGHYNVHLNKELLGLRALRPRAGSRTSAKFPASSVLKKNGGMLITFFLLVPFCLVITNYMASFVRKK